ncbi:hypothetical protein D3C80_1222290 [compost metagenome]
MLTAITILSSSAPSCMVWALSLMNPTLLKSRSSCPLLLYLATMLSPASVPTRANPPSSKKWHPSGTNRLSLSKKFLICHWLRLPSGPSPATGTPVCASCKASQTVWFGCESSEEAYKVLIVLPNSTLRVAGAIARPLSSRCSCSGVLASLRQFASERRCAMAVLGGVVEVGWPSGRTTIMPFVPKPSRGVKLF